MVGTDVFQKFLDGSPWKLNSQIHKNKVSRGLIHDYLLPKGLVLPETDYASEWYIFEEKTALLYMSLLAQYLADMDIDATIPGTDNILYEYFFSVI